VSERVKEREKERGGGKAGKEGEEGKIRRGQSREGEEGRRSVGGGWRRREEGGGREGEEEGGGGERGRRRRRREEGGEGKRNPTHVNVARVNIIRTSEHRFQFHARTFS
jgi:hypothetical protein